MAFAHVVSPIRLRETPDDPGRCYTLGMKATAAVLIGILLGIAAAAGDSHTGLGTSDLARVLFWIPNIGSLWVAAAFLAGTWFRRHWAAACVGLVTLAGAVISYYAFGLTLGDRSDVGLAAVGPTLLRWVAVAVVAGPLFGYLGFAFRRSSGVPGFAGALALPVVILAESGFQLVRALPYFGNDPWRDGALMVMFGVGLVLAVLFVRRLGTPGDKEGGRG